MRAAFDAYEYMGNYPYDVGGAGTPLVATTRDAGSGRWVTGEIQASRRFGSHHRFTAGVEQRLNLRVGQKATTEGFDEPDLDIHRRSSTSGAYAQDEWRLHKTLLLNFGARVDRYSRFANPFKPRAAAIYQPTDRTTMKVLFGEAFRAPNAYESDYAYQRVYKGNADLRPEEIRTVEGVVEHYAGRRVRFSGSVFHYSVTGLIDQALDPADHLIRYANLNAVDAVGFETEVEAKWPGGIQARLSQTFSRARNRDMSAVLTNSPAHVIQALFSIPLVAKTFLGLDLRALSTRLNPNGGEVGRHVVPNLTISGPVLGSRMHFSVTVSNGTNQRYADPVATDFAQASVFQNGRTARGTVTWSF